MPPLSRHIAIGKLLLIICLLFSITIIGGNSPSISNYKPEKSAIDSVRTENSVKLNVLEYKLNQYELKKLPNK